MTDNNLILEIGTEEIPARFMPNTLKEIIDLATKELTDERIGFSSIESFGTPRRIVLTIHSLATKQTDLIQEFKGPARQNAFDSYGTPTRAAEGFAKGKGVNVENLEIRDVDGVDYIFAVKNEQGQETLGMLPDILKRIITNLSFPKSMYWYDPQVRFARPIRWILCLLGDNVIPFTLNNMKSGRISSGHRFLGASSMEIKGFDHYMNDLYDNYVIVDQNKRKEKMRSGIASLEHTLNGKVDMDPDLMEENLFLVEYPVPFYGSFDQRYLKLPEEVLITSMKHHQKYFPIRDAADNLMPHFIGVSNNIPSSINLIREGNERVLRARLEDAVFFWDEDLKKPLINRIDELKRIVNQEKLGTVYDKVERVTELSKFICLQLGHEDLLQMVERASMLSEADQVTNMVAEFPELQGVMGREYALQNGENPRVANALAERYLPKYVGDHLPTDIIGAIVGVSHRIIHMAGAFKAGFLPSGSQDPYGLRRAIRSINEIIWGMDIDVDIFQILDKAMDIFQISDQTTKENIRDFTKQRTLIQLKERNYEHNLIVLSMSVTGGRLLQTLNLVKAFSKVQNEEWFANLVTSAVRVKNILAKVDKISEEINPQLFQKEPETNLFNKVTETEPKVDQAIADNNWKDLMSILSELSPSVTAFFEDVMVMDENESVRNNRIALLNRCNRLFLKVGDLSQAKG